MFSTKNKCVAAFVNRPATNPRHELKPKDLSLKMKMNGNLESQKIAYKKTEPALLLSLKERKYVSEAQK